MKQRDKILGTYGLHDSKRDDNCQSLLREIIPIGQVLILRAEPCASI